MTCNLCAGPCECGAEMARRKPFPPVRPPPMPAAPDLPEDYCPKCRKQARHIPLGDVVLLNCPCGRSRFIDPPVNGWDANGSPA